MFFLGKTLQIAPPNQCGGNAYAGDCPYIEQNPVRQPYFYRRPMLQRGRGGAYGQYRGIRSTLSDSYMDRIADGKGRVILTASAANEVSMEDQDPGHGIFTYYLIKGFKGMADYDNNGYLTVEEAYRYVSEEVPKATGQAQGTTCTGGSFVNCPV